MARGEKIKNPQGTPTGPVFEARWSSNCAGEEIVMVDGEAWHKECAEEAGYQVPRS